MAGVGRKAACSLEAYDLEVGDTRSYLEMFSGCAGAYGDDLLRLWLFVEKAMFACGEGYVLLNVTLTVGDPNPLPRLAKDITGHNMGKQRFADLEVDVLPFATTRIPRCPRNPGNQPHRADINPDNKDVIPHQGKRTSIIIPGENNLTSDLIDKYHKINNLLDLKLIRLLKEFAEIFPTDPFKVPTLHIQPVQIKPNTDRVIRLRPYRIPFTYRKEIDIQINEMLKNNIIEPAIGDYASPITLNYSISELECLAIIESIEYFRVYLLGRHFTIYSDHQALVYLKNIKNPSGKNQLEADLLSRQPFCGFLEAQQLEEHQHRVPEKYQSLINTDGLAIITKKGVPRVVVPDILRNKLLQKAHECKSPTVKWSEREIECNHNRETKDTPFRTPQTDMDQTDRKGHQNLQSNSTYSDGISSHLFIPELSEARRIALQKTQARHKAEKLMYDQKHKNIYFVPGDLVLVKVYRHPNTPKLEPNYTGPYEIFEILSPQVVRINRPNRPLQLQTEIINIEKLRRYVENIPHITPPTDFPDSPPRQNYFLFPYRHFTTYILGDPGSSRPRKWFQPFNHLDNSIFTDEKFYKPDFPITSEPTFSSIVKPTKSSTLVLDPKINPFYNMVEKVLHINKETIRTILHEDLGKTKVCVKFVQHTLTGEQKSLRIAHCRDIISAYENDSNFLKSIVTGDETWCFQYDPKTKCQSAEWKSKNSRQANKKREKCHQKSKQC
ncbi:hypothetical protein LAZ67_5002550 [Cordylochernes scorpioides]|uniref:Reverse transcriptase RNase H-like domain-containing protein n=1 Tax=Cordylochernes scorpioides TaxID=51811 RepID=A0ABY6KGS1_9ARAC|nr:hypothetical protein LAZ67_5002550 [Cordylochernes scorpioides]